MLWLWPTSTRLKIVELKAMADLNKEMVDLYNVNANLDKIEKCRSQQVKLRLSNHKVIADINLNKAEL